jgi:hypothetical protein
MARLINADKLFDKAESKYKCASGNSRQIYRGFLDDIADAPPWMQWKWLGVVSADTVTQRGATVTTP